VETTLGAFPGIKLCAATFQVNLVFNVNYFLISCLEFSPCDAVWRSALKLHESLLFSFHTFILSFIFMYIIYQAQIRTLFML
jgi:hypothetical protein